jgi:eukaryotic translation initiation factor 2C
MQYISVGRSFYTPEGSQALQGGLEAWQGYYQSARPTFGRMMINVDLTATPFYEGGSLVEMVTKVLGRGAPDELRRGFDDRERVKLEKVLKNLKIRVIHRGETTARRRYKITRLTPASASETHFDIGDGNTIDVATYFQRQYSRLNYPFLPCVVVRRDVFLPMEVCEVIEVQCLRHN